MPEDGEGTVQNQEPVSPTEPVSTEGQADVETQPKKEEALTLQAVPKFIEEAVAKAVAEAKEIGRRELQSQQDRNKAALSQAEKRANLAEKALESTQETLAKLDPETAKEIELAQLRAREQGRKALEASDTTAAQGEAYVKALREGLETHLEALGITKNDPKIDWADDAPDYLTGRARFDASVVAIIKEKQEATQSGFEKRLKEIEAKLNQDNVEANSVTTNASAGAVAGSDAEFIKKFGAGDLPVNKENTDRYNKIIAKE